MDLQSYPVSRRCAKRLAAACAVLVASAAAAAPQSPFVAVVNGVWNGAGDPIIPEIVIVSPTAPVSAERGARPDAFGSVQALYGSTGFDMQVSGGIDREVDVGSLWTDGLTVQGGSGSATLQVSARIHGSVSGHGEMFYGFFISTLPFDLQAIITAVDAAPAFGAVVLPDATRMLFTGLANRCGQSQANSNCGFVPLPNYQGALDTTLGASLPFTYGQTLYVASIFGGGVGVFGGSETFAADIAFGLPTGATLTAASGSTYPVPEPASAVLLVLGLLLMPFSWRVRTFRGRPRRRAGCSAP